jgi:outer membrane protein assembly factor BamA
MRARSPVLLCGLLTILGAQTSSALLFAQSNVCPDTPSHEKARPGAKLIVDNLELQGENPFSDADWAKLGDEIKEAALDDPWNLNDNRELVGLVEPIHAQLQDQGYFKSVVRARAFLNRAETDALHYTLNISLETGVQYHLGHIRIRNQENAPLALDENLLRDQFKLTEGDLFNVAKVRDGLDTITRLYGSKGFIDMVPTLETEIHNADSRLDLVVTVDEGFSYRISRIEVLGLDATAVQSLKLPQPAGVTFNRSLWWRYFEESQ